MHRGRNLFIEKSKSNKQRKDLPLRCTEVITECTEEGIYLFLRAKTLKDFHSPGRIFDPDTEIERSARRKKLFMAKNKSDEQRKDFTTENTEIKRRAQRKKLFMAKIKSSKQRRTLTIEFTA